MPLRLNLPPLTRALLLALLALSALNATIRVRDWNLSLQGSETSRLGAVANPVNYLSDPKYAQSFLVLVPLKSLKYPWTFITAPLVENNVVAMSISLAVLWAGGRYLERAYGSNEFARFVAVATIIPNVLTFLIYAVWHTVVGTPAYPTPIQGLVALEAAFLVALKQLVPEHTVSLFRGAVRVRIKHFPALFTLLNILSGPLLGTDTALWLSLWGFLASWVYLRFYRLADIGASSAATASEGSMMRGDASDTFAFVAFWPDAMQGLLAPVCDGVHAALVRSKLFTPFTHEAVEAGNEHAAARSEGLPSIMNGRGGGGRRAEAERRRAIALVALEQRLNAPPAGTGLAAGTAASAANTANGGLLESAGTPDGLPAKA